MRFKVGQLMKRRKQVREETLASNAAFQKCVEELEVKKKEVEEKAKEIQEKHREVEEQKKKLRAKNIQLQRLDNKVRFYTDCPNFTHFVLM